MVLAARSNIMSHLNEILQTLALLLALLIILIVVARCVPHVTTIATKPPDGEGKKNAKARPRR